MSTFWTEAKEETLRVMIAQGRTLECIGNAVGMTRHGIGHKAKKMGLKPTSGAQHWPAERVEQLKELFAEGLSGSLIAAELGITRNAVIGKLARLGLTQANGFRPSPPKHAKSNRPAVTPPRAVISPSAPAPEPLHVALLDLGRGQCRFPYGEGPFTFCGCQAIDNSPYCPAHHEQTHMPARAA